MPDPLNRVVSPLGDRLQKQKEAISRFEQREMLIKAALAGVESEAEFKWALETIQAVVDGELDGPLRT